MRLGSGWLLLAIACAAPAISASTARAPAPARSDAIDLIMTHGRIRTPSGWAEALAIRDGVIVAVGTAATVEALRARETQVFDLGGSTVLPGLHDVHVHPLFGGLSERVCRIAQGSDLRVTQSRVKACAEKARPGAWITGGQWDASAIGQAPNRAMLDAVTRDHPVLLDDTSGHSSWSNSRALEVAGVTRDTPNPKGGIIERDAAGEPTGVLREEAIELVRKHVPGPSDQEVRSALAWSLEKMLSFGITSYTEASVGFSAGAEKELNAYVALADAGVLKQRVHLCLAWVANEEAEAVLASRNLYARDRVSPDCVKIFLDGVPTDSHTAAMLQPYVGKVSGREDEASRSGMLLVEQSALDEAVTRFDRMGLTVKFHSAGDAAVRAGLNAIAAARKANGFSGQMHNVGHCTFVAKDDIARARAIGATFEVSPYLWGPSPINDDITAAVGGEIIKRVWPVREMIESGALVVPGSDWSVVPSVNPWIGIETLVTREKPGGSDQTFGKAEAISLDQAVDLFTVNAARQEGAGDRIGRLETGMLADLIVVDRNPFDVPIRDVHATKVKMTFINGELVYDASSPAPSAAAAPRNDQWLMVVKTVNTDPKREAQFNDWYDKIDVPDVLEVPGYMRARRGVKTAIDGDADDGKYVALYNMQGPSIDRIMVDMLMATLKMSQRGRSTDLLKVVERVYYREYSAPIEGAKPAPTSGTDYLFIVRSNSGPDAPTDAAFNQWYDSTYLPAILATDGVTRATRYELYRVLMFEPKDVPRYLTVVEIRADSASEARRRLESTVSRLRSQAGVPAAFRSSDEHLYLRINDVPRPVATNLKVDVYPGGFASVNSFIFSNGKSLVLLDAQRKTYEARKLADVIRAQHLPLTHILISHGHTDHFTGMAYLHEQFPDAQIVVANEAIRQDIKNYAIYMDTGGQTGAEPALEPALRPRSATNPTGFDYENTIQILKGNRLTLDGGGTLELTTDYLAAEAPHMTTVYSPEMNALFLADFGYNKVHLWLGDDITRDRIATWRAELLRIQSKYAALNPKVYPGHGEPTDMTMFDTMVRYIDDFLRITAAAKSRDEAMQAMTALYPDYKEADFFLKYSVVNHVK
jgi:predicted amidohydrolase YtcJ/glyoxylase-like metal-dependent hydrolase (beta-lactamase superfamily II)